jgi:predicted Fe-S protein YdhL (DUF1289 family)
MKINWQKATNDQKREIIKLMDKEDIEIIKQFKEVFDAQVETIIINDKNS